MEVRTKDQEIQAAEMRLSHLEQDMVEMSTLNENYRSQVMNLTTKADIAETELRALRNQDSWISPDLQVSSNIYIIISRCPNPTLDFRIVVQLFYFFFLEKNPTYIQFSRK